MKIVYPLISASLLIGSVAGIYGGAKVEKGAKPYATSIRSSAIVNGPENYNFCGGALISAQYVLTSVECTAQFEQFPNIVVVGAHRGYGVNDGEVIVVLNVSVHPQFDTNTVAYNYAVLKLAKASTKQPVMLTKPDTVVKANTMVTLLGWGLTADDSWVPDELRKLDQKVISNKECKEAVGQNPNATQVCVANRKGGSMCEGDAGSPVIYENTKGKSGDDVLIGIARGGYECGTGDPDVHTLVAPGLEWINSIIKG